MPRPMMNEQEQRIARTESLFRGVNGPRFSLVEKIKPVVRRTAEQLNPRAQEA